MNRNVLYLSKTGHSKKIADAIAQELNLPSADLKDSPALPGTDLLFLVTGIYGGKCDPKVLEFIDTLSPQTIRRVCLVTSSAGNTAAVMARQALERRGIPVAREEYTCRGSFLFFGMGHPNARELAGAVDFARNMIQAQQ